MSIQSDFERLQKVNLRKRQRISGEIDLKKAIPAPKVSDLSPTVIANRRHAENRAKIQQLRRGP